MGGTLGIVVSRKKERKACITVGESTINKQGIEGTFWISFAYEKCQLERERIIMYNLGDSVWMGYHTKSK